MPRSTLAHESIGSMSDSEDLSHFSDEESVVTDVDSPSLSDQTLLKQAFSGAVHCRKSTAQDWRHERETQFVEESDCSADSEAKNNVSKGRSYSSRIRGFVKKIAFAGKKSA